MATILIIGASRGIGLETVREALHAGHNVRALSRSAKSIEVNHANLTKIAASASDAQAVSEAVNGCDAVITCIGIAPTFQTVNLFSETIAIVIEAMETNHVKRLIAVTGIGAGDSSGVGGLLYTKFFQPVFLGTIYEDKTREEELIKQSSLEWTIVRPGFLTRLPKKGKYKALKEKKDWMGGFISRSDVADFLVQQIEDQEFVKETPLLIG